MVNTGVAITLLTKTWVDTHSLSVKEKVAKYISSTNGTLVRIMDMTSMILLQVPILEVDMAKVSVCLGDFYQGFLACDLLCGHNEAFNAAAVTLPGLD